MIKVSVQIFTVFVIVCAVGILLFYRQENAKKVNQIENNNIWWSDQWKSVKEGKTTLKQTQYPGSEIAFRFKDAKSIGFRVNTDDIEGSTQLKILIDENEYLLSNPNINDKRLFVVIPEHKIYEEHTVHIYMYCIVGVSTCKIKLSEIDLEDGSILSSKDTNDKKIVGVLGDSVSLVELRYNYSAKVSEDLGYHLHNASYWGRTISTDKGKYPAVLHYKKDLTAYKPDLIIIFLGINDVTSGTTAESFEKDYDKLIKGIKKELPKSKIVAVSILPGRESNEFSEKIIEFNTIIKDVAKSNMIPFADTGEWMTIDDYNDQIHPNARGEINIANHMLTYFSQNNIR